MELERVRSFDGLGLFGRIATLGENTSRIIFVTDSILAFQLQLCIEKKKKQRMALFPELTFLTLKSKSGYSKLCPADPMVSSYPTCYWKTIKNNNKLYIQLKIDFSSIEREFYEPQRYKLKIC